jgi:sulfur carrier protein
MNADEGGGFPICVHLRPLRIDPFRAGIDSMELTVNGKPRDLEQAMTLAAFLAALNLHERMIVVERNGEIVRRERFADTLLEAGDTLEIVQMMAGG